MVFLSSAPSKYPSRSFCSVCGYARAASLIQTCLFSDFFLSTLLLVIVVVMSLLLLLLLLLMVVVVVVVVVMID
jgi:hypothetical protein